MKRPATCCTACHGPERGPSVDAARFGGDSRHERVGVVEAAGERQVDRVCPPVGPRAARAAVGRRHERHLRLGAREAAPRARPAALAELDPAVAGRAAHGVELPAQSGAHPVHVARDTGPPDHQRVVGIRDDVGVRRRGERRPPATRHHPHLVGAVQLVTRQVEQHHDDRPRRGEHPREVDLVHLQDGAVGVGSGQCGDMTRRHVRPGLVAHHLVTGGAERHRQQPRRRGLAVRPGDECHLAPRAQVLEELRIEPQPGPASGDGSLAAARAAATPR